MQDFVKYHSVAALSVAGHGADPGADQGADHGADQGADHDADIFPNLPTSKSHLDPGRSEKQGAS